MNIFLHYLYSIVHASHENDPIVKSISEVEVDFLRVLIKYVGYEWAVRIEDMLIILNSIILTTVVFILFIAFLIRGKNKYSIRFSDEMKGFVYLWAERGDIKEVIVKKPENFIDKVGVIIAFFWIRFFDHIPLRERRAKRIALFIIFLFVAMLITMTILFLFTLNVFHSEKVATILPSIFSNIRHFF